MIQWRVKCSVFARAGALVHISRTSLLPMDTTLAGDDTCRLDGWSCFVNALKVTATSSHGRFVCQTYPFSKNRAGASRSFRPARRPHRFLFGTEYSPSKFVPKVSVTAMGHLFARFFFSPLQQTARVDSNKQVGLVMSPRVFRLAY